MMFTILIFLMNFFGIMMNKNIIKYKMLTEFHKIYGYNENKELVNKFINKRIEEKCYMVNDFLQWKMVKEISNQIDNQIIDNLKGSFFVASSSMDNLNCYLNTDDN